VRTFLEQREQSDLQACTEAFVAGADHGVDVAGGNPDEPGPGFGNVHGRICGIGEEVVHAAEVDTGAEYGRPARTRHVVGR
jgi:hypothetical protein